MAFITGKTLQGNCGAVFYTGDGHYCCSPIPDIPGVDPRATDHINFYAKIQGEVGEVVDLDIQYPIFDEQLCGPRKYQTKPFFTVAHRCVYVSDDELNWERVENVEVDSDAWTLRLSLTLTAPVCFVSVNYFYTVKMYEELRKYMAKADFVEEKAVGLSRDGQKIYLYKITDTAVPEEEKKIVYLQGAQHCCEYGGPLLLDAMMRYLCGGSDEARGLLRKYEFHITPIFSVADWAEGNKDVLLADPNTVWDTLSTPEVKAIDAYLRGLAKKPALLIDLHNARKNYFFLSDYLPAEQVEEQLRFAYLICKYCDYITPDNIARKGRGKYANFREYGWENFDSGYTFELSRFGFYDREAGCEKPLSKESFTKFGSQLPLAIDAFLAGEEA